MPHGHCYFWTPSLLWLNVISDGLTALAYFSIPFTLIYLIRKRRDLPFNWVFIAFGIFILACGATHIMAIWTTWYPAYWLSGYVRAVTAVASVVTAFLLIRLIPAALEIPSQCQLLAANTALEKVNEELREANQRLEKTHRELLQREKMAALGRLVAGVAHEINTPIGIIVTGSSAIVQETLQVRHKYRQHQLSEEELETYFATAEQSSKLMQVNATRAADLVQSFKMVAVDQSVEQRRDINVAKYINETLASLSPALKRAPVTVTVSGPAELVINTYPGALSQALTNLVQNSLCHGFDDGPGHIHIRFATQDDQVVLRYSDNGKGIPTSIREKVFEPFFTTNRDKGGSGLGLHIFHNLVTGTLRGRVQIVDPPVKGQGVQFIVEFPVNDTESACATVR